MSSTTWCCYHGDCRKVLFLPCVIKVVLNVFIDIKCYFKWELAEFGCVLCFRCRYTICTQKVQQSRKQITPKLPKPNPEQLTGTKPEPAEHTIWQTHGTHHGLSQILLPVCGESCGIFSWPQVSSGLRRPEPGSVFLQKKWVQVHSSEWICQIWHVSLYSVFCLSSLPTAS